MLSLRQDLYSQKQLQYTVKKSSEKPTAVWEYKATADTPNWQDAPDDIVQQYLAEKELDLFFIVDDADLRKNITIQLTGDRSISKVICFTDAKCDFKANAEGRISLKVKDATLGRILDDGKFNQSDTKNSEKGFTVSILQEGEDTNLTKDGDKSEEDEKLSEKAKIFLPTVQETTQLQYDDCHQSNDCPPLDTSCNCFTDGGVQIFYDAKTGKIYRTLRQVL